MEAFLLGKQVKTPISLEDLHQLFFLGCFKVQILCDGDDRVKDGFVPKLSGAYTRFSVLEDM